MCQVALVWCFLVGLCWRVAVSVLCLSVFLFSRVVWLALLFCVVFVWPFLEVLFFLVWMRTGVAILSFVSVCCHWCRDGLPAFAFMVFCVGSCNGADFLSWCDWFLVCVSASWFPVCFPFSCVCRVDFFPLFYLWGMVVLFAG